MKKKYPNLYKIIENTVSDFENPIEEIEFIINSIIDFSNKNEYDYKLYKSFAKESSKSFNRYFSQIDNETDKEKIISNLKTNFNFWISDIVNSMNFDTKIHNPEPEVTYYIPKPTPDNRIRGYESNYRQLIKLFSNEIPQLNATPKIEILPPVVPAPENSLNWNGTQTEFIELIKALIENGNIKGTQIEIISKLSNVFNIEIKHPNKLITDIKKRNNGSETLFLDKLQKSLLDYITLEKKK